VNRLKVKKDDVVEVISGKDKGRRGKVLSVMPKIGSVLVEKVNMIKRHQKPNPQMRQGGIIEKENKILVEKVMVVCQKCDKAVRVGKKVLQDGKRVRFCRSCGEVLDVG
jgi:large subunit ribosomal protein L24